MMDLVTGRWSFEDVAKAFERAEVTNSRAQGDGDAVTTDKQPAP